MRFSLFFFILTPFLCAAQFAPAAGKPGSTALRHDSSCFKAWATSAQIFRGYKDISNPDSGFASVGDSLSATGPAMTGGVVSLGDGGWAVLEFMYPIKDGPGWDFAVFENSFLDSFLELAFVEVSTDGKKYVRFPSESLSDTVNQCGPFGSTRPEKVNNLAGKYIVGYGTPFDLSELKDSSGIDIMNIRFVKVVDVVGCLNPIYARHDVKGRKINDPWPTPFPSSGFDLDAVGVIHQDNSAAVETPVSGALIFPNPVINNKISIFCTAADRLKVYNMKGMEMKQRELQAGLNEFSLDLPCGLYYFELRYEVHTIQVIP